MDCKLKKTVIDELTVSSNLKGLTEKFNDLFCKAPFSEVQNFWDKINLCLNINFKTKDCIFQPMSA